jgi:hypothetical protein
VAVRARADGGGHDGPVKRSRALALAGALPENYGTPAEVPVATFYLTCLILGGVVLVGQFLLSLVGIDGDGWIEEGGLEGSLDLFTVRALSAASAFFGVTGLGLMQLGLNGWLALPVALGIGFASAIGVARVVRAMKRMDTDKSFEIAMTLGQQAKVALSVPGARAGAGKVHLTAHDRFLELDAVTAEETIPSGDTVYVIDAISSDTVLVARHPSLLEESNVRR